LQVTLDQFRQFVDFGLERGDEFSPLLRGQSLSG